MNKIDRSILIGMILGDGYIQKTSLGTLCIQHSQAQLDYIAHKANLLHKLLGGKLPKIHAINRLDSRTGKVYKTCYISKTHKYISILRDWIYLNNKKTYTRKILDYLTPEGIALWYMDDGGCHITISKKTGKISSGQSYLYTYCTEIEAKIIQQYFLETFNIQFNIQKRKTNQCCLCANTANSKKFVRLIRPYIIETMQYKLRHIPIDIFQEHSASKDEDIV